MSTVLGIVGARGIGFVLNEARRRIERARVALPFFVIPGRRAFSEASSAWGRGG